MSNTKHLLNLDEIVPPQFAVVIDGVSHDIVTVSVEDFIRNMQLVQSAGEKLSLDEEVDLIIKILERSIPSITAERLRKLTLRQLKALLEFVKKCNGEADEEVSGSDAENPPKPAS